MKLKKVNNFLFISSIFILIITIFLKVFSCFHSVLPEFKDISKITIIGCDEEFMFIDLFFEIENKSVLPFVLENMQLYLHDNQDMISELSVVNRNTNNNKIFISSVSNETVNIRTSLKKEYIKHFVENKIDLYSFRVTGQSDLSVFNIRKQIDIHHYLILDFGDLMQKYLSNTLKSIFIINNVTLNVVSGLDNYRFNNQSLELSILVYNKSGLNLKVNNINADIFINRSLSGSIEKFYPQFIKSKSTSDTIKLIFILDKIPADELSSLRLHTDLLQNNNYLIEGTGTFHLWGKSFTIPIEIIK